MATIKRKAEAQWSGSRKDGSGALTTQSGTLSNTPYSFYTRFENGAGTNPEELIAAAQAGCFTMSLANLLSEAGSPPRDLNTTARVRLEQKDEGFRITRIAISTVGDVPGFDPERFVELAEQAKATCPVSLALAGTEIVLEATLQ